MQFSNKRQSISSKKEAIETFCSDEQLLKTEDPSFFTYDGIDTFSKDMHPEKVYDSITFICGMENFFNDWPIIKLVTVTGIKIASRDVQSEKADSPIKLTERGIDTCDSQPQKVELSIFVIEEGMDFCVRNLKRLF